MRLFLAIACGVVAAHAPDAAADADACAALDGAFDADRLIEATRYEGGEDAARCVAIGRLSAGGRFALALPERWNERLIALGCDGFCGRLDIDAVGDWAATGYAALSYDGGHGAADSADAAWAHHNPAAEAAWAGGAIVAAVAAAKATIADYYPEDLRFTYARGCGDGGRQALALAARAPDAVDGLALYAPVVDPGGQHGPVAAWRRRALLTDAGGPRFTAADAATLAQAATAACDAEDGAADGLIADPAACGFRPADAVCGDARRGDLACLTPQTADAATLLYQDPTDGFGERLAIGRMSPGAEGGLAAAGLTAEAAAGARWARMHESYVRHMSTEFEIGAAWSPTDYDFDRDPLDGERARAEARIAPGDLAAFFDRGGRAIILHGRADPLRAPAATEAFAQGLGDAAADGAWIGFAPGVEGCGVDPGRIEATALTGALESWVEVGEAPDGLSANPPRAGGGDRLVPICRWPATLRDGANCVAP